MSHTPDPHDVSHGDPALTLLPFNLLLAERLLMHHIWTRARRNGDQPAEAAAYRCITALAAEMDRRDCGS